MHLSLEIGEEECQIGIGLERDGRKLQFQNRILDGDVTGGVPEREITGAVIDAERMLVDTVEDHVKKGAGWIIPVFLGPADEKTVIVPDGVAVGAEGSCEVAADHGHAEESTREKRKREHDFVPPERHETSGESIQIREFRSILRLSFVCSGGENGFQHGYTVS